MNPRMIVTGVAGALSIPASTRRFWRAFLPFLMFGLALCSSAHASDGPTLDIGVGAGNGLFSIQWVEVTQARSAEVYFGASIRPQVAPFAGYPPVIDVYFGAITPLQAIGSWVPNDDPIAMFAAGAPGLKPLARDVSVPADGYRTASSLQDGRQKAAYRFTASDAKGVYVIFCLAVYAGKDPADPANWVNSGAKMFIVK